MKFPNYSEVELQHAIDSEIVYPRNITELDFFHQIQSNKRIRWDVNPSVTQENQIRILLNPSYFNWWKSMQRIAYIIGLFIVYWGLRIWTVDMLLLLVLFPFIVAPLPHFVFVLCIGIVISITIFTNVHIPLFWIIISLTIIAYSIIKNMDEVATRFIIKQGLSDWETFWRYYSKKIIFPVLYYNPDEIKYLIERYPELILDDEKKE